jgi:hypothetical protein
MKSKSLYNIDLCKGTGMIQETLFLLEKYNPETTKEIFVKDVFESNILVKSSSKRIKDIINNVFYKRYVINDKYLPVYLLQLHRYNVGLDQLIQIMLIYIARSNRIFFDFVTDVYWLKNRENTLVTSNDAKLFIIDAIKDGRIALTWSDGTKKRVASYIIATLMDIKFLDKKYNCIPVFLSDKTANYLSHELHFKGYSDEAIAIAEEWKLFGYNHYDVTRHFERLAAQGHFIFQNAGDLIKITWKYNNMNELIDAIGQ